MADFLTRMAERALNVLPTVIPVIGSKYASEPTIADMQTGPMAMNAEPDLGEPEEAPDNQEEKWIQVPSSSGDSPSQPLVLQKGHASAPLKQYTLPVSPTLPESSSIEHGVEEGPVPPSVSQELSTPGRKSLLERHQINQADSLSEMLPEASSSNTPGFSIPYIGQNPSRVAEASSKALPVESPSGPRQNSSALFISPSPEACPEQIRLSISGDPLSPIPSSMSSRSAPLFARRAIPNPPPDPGLYGSVQETTGQNDEQFLMSADNEDRSLIRRSEEHSVNESSSSMPIRLFNDAHTSQSLQSAGREAPESVQTGIIASGLLLPDAATRQTSRNAGVLPTSSAPDAFDVAASNEAGFVASSLPHSQSSTRTERTGRAPGRERSIASPREIDITPTIYVTIGRVDVRAMASSSSAPPSSPKRSSSRPALSLDDYLKQRNGGHR